VRHDRSGELGAIRGADEDGRRLERIEAGIVQRVGHRPDLLDVDAVDLLDLLDEEVLEPGLREVDHQLVDRSAGPSLEDVDADDLAPHGTDPAGDLPERARAVGQPHADDVGLHGEHGTDGL
jgi:hypothetical protein